MPPRLNATHARLGRLDVERRRAHVAVDACRRWSSTPCRCCRSCASRSQIAPSAPTIFCASAPVICSVVAVPFCSRMTTTRSLLIACGGAAHLPRELDVVLIAVVGDDPALLVVVGQRAGEHELGLGGPVAVDVLQHDVLGRVRRALQVTVLRRDHQRAAGDAASGSRSGRRICHCEPSESNSSLPRFVVSRLTV